MRRTTQRPRLMRSHRFLCIALLSALTGGITFAQVGRGGSPWLTGLGDAQRTSWIRTDAKISVESMSTPGFDLQWTTTLDNERRAGRGLSQGVTADGVTLFVPMSLVTGRSNTVHAIDNDIGYVVWRRQFDAALPPATAECPGGITAAATRIVSLTPPASAPARGAGGRGSVGYRSLLGEPGEGVPIEGRGAAGAAPPAAAKPAPKPVPGPATAGRGAPTAAAASPAPGGRTGRPIEGIPGARTYETDTRIFFRPSGVVYVISSDGMLRVLGLASGKDMQKPAPFLPPNARWSHTVAVGTTLYAATSGGCGGAPDGVWAIDLESEAKPVASWKTNGGSVVGTVAFTSGGTLIAAIGPGATTGEGKANAIVALDPATLQLRDWYSDTSAEFVTGPTIFRHGERELVAAATRDGRILVLDAGGLGGPDHKTPLYASRPVLGAGGAQSATALATWSTDSASGATDGASGTAPVAAAGTTRWILASVGRATEAALPATNGPLTRGGVVALTLTEASGSLSLEPGWTSHDLAAPETPIIVNGVVFALGTGRPAPAAQGTPGALHAYDGTSGRALWTSGDTIRTSASPGSFWSGMGQVYVGTDDGTVYAFGFTDERR